MEKANAAAPAFARLFKEMMIVTSSDKPLPRSAKGTVIVKQAIALYADVINKLLSTVVSTDFVSGTHDFGSWWVLLLLAGTTPYATVRTPRACLDRRRGRVRVCSIGSSLTPASSLGTKTSRPQSTSSTKALTGTSHRSHPSFVSQPTTTRSLTATVLRNRIIATLRSSGEESLKAAALKVSPNIVYEQPTLNQLASAIAILTADAPSSSITSSSASTEDLVRDLMRKHASDVPLADVRERVTTPMGIVVLMTGSTGNIGSHVLAALLADSRVERVYVLNRGSPGVDDNRLVDLFARRGLPTDVLTSSRLVSLFGDVKSDKFALDDVVFSEVRTTDLSHPPPPCTFLLS